MEVESSRRCSVLPEMTRGKVPMPSSPSRPTFFDSGQHRGRTFNEVHLQEPGYVQWPRKVVRPRESGAFVSHCTATGRRPFLAARASLRPVALEGGAPQGVRRLRVVVHRDRRAAFSGHLQRRPSGGA